MQKEELTPEKWARCKFRGERYNLLTTNGAESINAVLKKAKRLPVLALLDICLKKTSEWFNKHRSESQSLISTSSEWFNMLTPRVEAVLWERYTKACTYEVDVVNSVTQEFIVMDPEMRNKKHAVNLSVKTCGCKVFDVDKYPCSHAIAAAHKIGKAHLIHELCSPYYLRETWRMAYEGTVYTVPDYSDWDLPAEIANFKVMPPILEAKRRSGRPKQNRYRGPGEVRSSTQWKKRRESVGMPESNSQASRTL